MLEEDLEKEIASLRKKGKNKYKEIIEAGIGLKKNVYELMKIIWDKEEIPSSWNRTTLIQIYKKGSHNSLESYRYVHIKDWMPRVLDGIVFTKMKQHLIENMSKFQIVDKVSGKSTKTSRRAPGRSGKCPMCL